MTDELECDWLEIGEDRVEYFSNGSRYFIGPIDSDIDNVAEGQLQSSSSPGMTVRDAFYNVLYTCYLSPLFNILLKLFPFSRCA